MLGFFKKKDKSVCAPLEGECIPLDLVNDEMFSKKMMGSGCAIIPTSNRVVSPINGKIILIADTGHAVGIRSNNGHEILIHIGLDTVNLEGKGFNILVDNNINIKKGMPIIEFDKKYLSQGDLDMTTMIIGCNIPEDNMYDFNYGSIKNNDEIFKIK